MHSWIKRSFVFLSFYSYLFDLFRCFSAFVSKKGSNLDMMPEILLSLFLILDLHAEISVRFDNGVNVEVFLKNPGFSYLGLEICMP